MVTRRDATVMVTAILLWTAVAGESSHNGKKLVIISRGSHIAHRSNSVLVRIYSLRDECGTVYLRSVG